jgi:hypothetical protein
VEFISDRMSYITLRVRCCDFVLNARAPTEDKPDYTKDNFYDDLERGLEQFPKHH